MNKLFFVDGLLELKHTQEGVYAVFEFGDNGFTETVKRVSEMNKCNCYRVITNLPYLLNLFWSEESQRHEVYIWQDDVNEFKHISELTNKEIRQSHNIENMFRNGAFVR